jgi:carbon monoxide dehydrogenase subunit G
MSSFSTSIHIARPVADVFAYVADPRNFPVWNSAVQAVTGDGRRFVMHRQLPGGPVTNDLEITESDPPNGFAIRTTSGPTPFRYRYRFEPDGDGTRLTLDAEVELSGLAAIAPGIAASFVKRGVDANFATLKGVLE